MVGMHRVATVPCGQRGQAAVGLVGVRRRGQRRAPRCSPAADRCRSRQGERRDAGARDQVCGLRAFAVRPVPWVDRQDRATHQPVLPTQPQRHRGRGSHPSRPHLHQRSEVRAGGERAGRGQYSAGHLRRVPDSIVGAGDGLPRRSDGDPVYHPAPGPQQP